MNPQKALMNLTLEKSLSNGEEGIKDGTQQE